MIWDGGWGWEGDRGREKGWGIKPGAVGPCFAKPPSISPSLPFLPLMMVQG